ncbi:hypothetical protein PAP10c_p1002 (plasmid) [Pantoea agglomerans]|nr:hypothetical protein PAP10c_p1002 [Pantoea agglomerans]
MRVRPGAARTVKALRLVDFKQGDHILFHRHLAADSIGNRLQCAPASGGTPIRSDAICAILLFHNAPHCLCCYLLSLVQK